MNIDGYMILGIAYLILLIGGRSLIRWLGKPRKGDY